VQARNKVGRGVGQGSSSLTFSGVGKLVITSFRMKTYYPVVQALRGLATALVCFYHFVAYSDFRGVLFESDSVLKRLANACTGSVFIFFVLSAFVLPMSLLQKDGWKGFVPFMVRRIIRIEIPYILSIVLILVVGFLFAKKNHIDFVIDLDRLLHHLTYSIPFSQYEWHNIIFWTLAIECQFYLMVGLFFVVRSWGCRPLNYALIAAFAISGCFVQDHRLIFYYSPIFILGVLFLLIRMNNISLRMGMIAIWLTMIVIVHYHGLQIAAYSTFTLVAIQFGDRVWKYANTLGDMSYSIYLTHGISGGHVLYFFARYTDSIGSKVLLIVCAMLISLIVAWFFWKWIELPSHRMANQILLVRKRS
jgi:peptidoglycan/LPS O-acetylase OafA/YrhL